MLQLKTPIRYPGGKSKAIKVLEKHFIKDFDEYREPFIGGGSVFIHMKLKYPEKKFWINDLYYNLFCLWTALQQDGQRFEEDIKKIRLDNDSSEKMKTTFSLLREQLKDEKNVFEIGKLMYVLNKTSFNGMSTHYSALADKSTFSLNSISKISHFSKLLQGVKITNLDYNELLNESGEKVFIFLDPPYDIKCNNLYGKKGEMHKTFDHKKFCDNIKKCNHQWMITYNEEMKREFEEYHCEKIRFTYGMAQVMKEMENGEMKKVVNTKDELLVMNY